MKFHALIPTIFLIAFMAGAFAACVDDGKCTKEELALEDCLDCRTYVPEKNYCVDDGICTTLEESLGCSDCKAIPSVSITGFHVFAAGTLFLGLAVILIALFLAWKSFSPETKKLFKRKPRL